MKKNKCLRAAALLLACCMFSLCTITGTLARYMQDVPVDTNKVRAGLFRVAVKDGNGDWVVLGQQAVGDAIKVDLYDTLYEADDDEPDGILDEEENKDGRIDVLNAPGANPNGLGAVDVDSVIIAPGTGGKLKIEVENFSEVDVKISMALATDTGEYEPIEWWDADTNAWVDVFPGIPDGADTDELKSYPAALAAIGGPLGTSTITLTWRWKFERGIAPNTLVTNPNWYWTEDLYDTERGVGAVTKDDMIGIPLIITATQLD